MRPVDPCGLKRALLINDLSCFGKCSLSVSLPILSAYGVEAVPLPTAVLSTHTGGFTGYASVDMTEALRRFPAHWAQLGLRFDCIAVGYCTSAEQLRLAAALIRSLADEHTLVVVDPVLGDQGALYPGLKEAQVEAMRELCSLARWITPNRTEAALLAGLPASAGDRTLLQALQTENTVITSIQRENTIGFLARLGGQEVLLQQERLPLTPWERAMCSPAPCAASCSPEKARGKRWSGQRASAIAASKKRQSVSPATGTVWPLNRH